MMRSEQNRSSLPVFVAATRYCWRVAEAARHRRDRLTAPTRSPGRFAWIFPMPADRCESPAVPINKVHIHGDIRARGFLFNNPDKQARELSANPPIEQKPDVIRVGKELSTLNGVSVDYTIELPRNSEVSTSVASGSQTISDLQGPVKIDSASGSIVVSKIDRSVQVNTASGSISVQDLGDDFHANTASGSVSATNVKGDVRIHAISGSMNVSQPGARVEASDHQRVRGYFWRGKRRERQFGFRTCFGERQSFRQQLLEFENHFGKRRSCGAAVGEFSSFGASGVRGYPAGIPIVIEDQDKHSLRARVGNAGGRVEIHTVSGGIRLQPAS